MPVLASSDTLSSYSCFGRDLEQTAWTLTLTCAGLAVNAVQQVCAALFPPPPPPNPRQRTTHHTYTTYLYYTG